MQSVASIKQSEEEEARISFIVFSFCILSACRHGTCKSPDDKRPPITAQEVEWDLKRPTNA
jgi:hypothetical protein